MKRTYLDLIRNVTRAARSKRNMPRVIWIDKDCDSSGKIKEFVCVNTDESKKKCVFV